MRIASVVLDIATQALEGAYSYLADDLSEELAVGCAVLVPFGGRQAIGFVMAIDEHDDATAAESLGFDPSKLKRVQQVITRPLFTREGSALARFLARRYVAPLASCVRLLTPPGGVPKVVREGRRWKVEQPAVGEVDDRWVRLAPGAADFTPRKGAVRQAAIIEALRAGELRVAELAAEYGNVNPVIKALQGHGVVEVVRRRRMRGSGVAGKRTEYATVFVEPVEKPSLTPGQSSALEGIRAARSHGEGRVVVVDGVTGSGKTELYLRAIEDVVDAGQTAIVLVPEISLTPQTVARFRGRFGDMVAVLHSRMSTGERYDQWDFIYSGAARVVVGARSALFAPVRDVGLIVIDEEHEGSYKQDSAPRYVSRDVATWMAARWRACLLLGSATPSIEALHRVSYDSRWSMVRLPERANGRPMPPIDVVDMAQEFAGGSRSMFSRALLDALHDALAARTKAVLLLNQRGFASFLLCRDCGFVPECPHCSTSLTYHEDTGMLVCHHCASTRPAPASCPECNSPYLKKFGAGTQRVEAELHAVLAGFEDVSAQVIRMDADTTKGKGAHERLLEEFAAAECAVLLGTQMIAKGLDFDDVTLVGVVNADTQLRLPDFRAAERTFCLIEQVAGRAGRASLPGRVIVQTYSADHAAIQAAAHYDRDAFLASELPKRKALGYPPFARLADVRVWGKVESQVKDEAASLHRMIETYVRDVAGASWTVLPPTPCVLSRLRGNYRYHITIKTPPDCDIGRALEPLFRGRAASKDVNVAVDVDPQSLL